jgi:transcriptional regulator with XRE-family HTH domain
MEWGAATILSLRKQARMTQAQLAHWLGVTVKQVKHLEHQRRKPSGPATRLLDILAERLGSTDPNIQVLGAGAAWRKTPVRSVEQQSTWKAMEPPEQDAGQELHAGEDGAFVWE